jgi:tetratricopeptide (TPR) repeat protein/tRNA A-37 threonylcarbamoyl transferase component Bud32
MNAERWPRIEELFHRAADLAPTERAAFLDEACAGDDDLRRDVDALLAHDATQDGAMQAAVGRAVEQLPDDSTASGGFTGAGSAPLSPWLPATIGRYRILRFVAEGGMGIVYEAEQEQPRRVVALKVIKHGQSSSQLLRRFDQESQALARLQHSGIAQIYEAGTADTGSGPQPFFAMEFIRGQALLNYAEAHGLDTRQRLEMMAKICDAVQHAHQRGLIHRDLKPGNILVDETGQPKILDFGIARVTDSDTRATRQTDVGQLVGTLAYMSPEQVLGNPLELDTRSDVYALGVIVYELLAGRLPHNLIGNPLEVMRMIREENPQPLSSVNRLYRGDIETIVSKALEKDKTRRYASAADLGADIQRYLRDEPIIARPPSATYQMQKFAHRHKALVAGVAAVFVVLIAGIGASTREATRARRAEQTATAVDDFLQNDLLAQASANAQARPDTKPDPDLKVRTALDRAATRIEGKFKEQPLVEAAVRQTIGNTYRDLGLFPDAQKQIERALDLRRRGLGLQHPDTLTSMHKLAMLYYSQGKYPQAEPLFTSVVKERSRVLGPLHRDTLDSMNNLALLYTYQGKFAQAEPLYTKVLEVRRRVLGEEHPETLDTMGNMAYLLQEQGKYPQAESLFTKALDRQRRVLGEEHPETLTTTNNLALLYVDQSRYAEAEPLYTKLLEVNRRVLGEEHPDTLGTMNNLALVYKAQGRYAQAEPLFTQVVAGARHMLGEEHRNTLVSMSGLAAIYQDEGKYEQSERLCTKVVEVSRRVLGEEHPDTLLNLNNLASLYRDQGKDAEAEPLLAKVLNVRRRVLGEEHPETLASISNLAVLYRDHGNFAQAEPMLVKVLDARRRILGGEHSATLTSMRSLAQLYLSEGKYTQAEPLLREAMAGRQKTPTGAWDRYYCENLLGTSLAGTKQYAAAEPALLSGYAGMLQEETTVPVANKLKVEQAGRSIIQFYKDWGKPEKAAMWTQKLRAAGVQSAPSK